MDWKAILKKNGKGSLVKMGAAGILALGLVKIFAPEAVQAPDPDRPFSMKTCMEYIPEDVDGLKVIEGSRSKASIIHEMVPITCKARAIFERMKEEGAAIKSGRMIVRVVVEYNGEVISVRIEASDISYRPLRNRVIDLIADSDFNPWHREDTDTEFLYPIHLGRR